MIPYSRPKLSDLYTLSQSKRLENHTLHSGTYLYSPYMEVPPRRFIRWIALSAFLTTFWSQLYDSLKSYYYLKGPLATLMRCRQLRNFNSFYLTQTRSIYCPRSGLYAFGIEHDQKLKALAISCVSDYTQTHVTAYINCYC